jgi:hypothetical protein
MRKKLIAATSNRMVLPHDYHLWEDVRGAAYKDNPHILLVLKEAKTSLRLNCRVSLQARYDVQMRVYKHVEALSSVYCKLSRTNVFVLMYSESEIILVYGRCTRTFGPFCIMK